MVKFFLPEARENSHKHKTEYCILAYREFLELVKSKHLQYISKTVQQIKETK
jgi:hypothetical protein